MTHCLLLLACIAVAIVRPGPASASPLETDEAYRTVDPEQNLAMKEAPMLDELVQRGKLPPLKLRLPDDPMVVQTVAELGEEKVRFYSMMTDCVPSEVEVGTPVALTFRRIYEGMGMHNYFWKCRPLNIAATAKGE